jgi:hypothetical protein
MPGDADLEFGLTWNRPAVGGGALATTAAVLDADRLDVGELEVNLRFQNPDENVDRLLPRVPAVTIDFARLRQLSHDEQSYGHALSEMVLRRDDVLPFFHAAVAATQSGDLSLHLRLNINAPPQFHALRWESLRDPDAEDPIATRSGVLLSRYVTSPDWRPIPAVAKHDLHALVVVAGPTDLAKFSNQRKLADVQVEDEVERARTALAGLREIKVLANGDATLAGMLASLDAGVDVLYLVCHGALLDDVPVLYLEKPDRTTDRVDGRKLVERFMGLARRPTVVMLCSCQSASGPGDQWSTDEGSLSALGPRLAGAGVPAVVAMQGNVRMATARAFSLAFFRALADHGVVDRAMATARREVRGNEDWWVPVLFSRLRSGRTYYRPEFTERADDTWEALRVQLRTGGFTPVLGPGLADSILGSRQDIARRWVKRWQMPLAAHSQGDLAQVAQYLRVRSAEAIVRGQLIDYLGEEIAKRSERAEPGSAFSDLTLDRAKPGKAIVEVGRRIRQADPGDPYRVAAALPVSVYVTTAVTDLLQAALREREGELRRDPVTLMFPWRDGIADVDALDNLEEPTPERPLVYHLFGRLETPRSLVLTEDDYFEWMAAWQTRRKAIPPVVRDSLVEKSLMFVGFQLDDWDFRVVFNALKSFGGRERFKEGLHVGVQLSPDSQLIEPEAAQEYFESYFGNDKVNIYWGETRHFFDDFRSRTGLET